MMEENETTGWVATELEGVSLPDQRFAANVIAITEQLNEHTGLSFSGACGERLRKSAWRLFSTGELDLLAVHQQRTLQRCAAEDTILVVEDTTDIHYRQPHKQGMGILGGTKAKVARGLNMHTALAVTVQGACLGIVHQHIWAPKAGRGTTNRRQFALEDKETIKWVKTLKAVNSCWQQQQQVVVVADREGDFFEHYAQPRKDNIRLLVRVLHKERKVCYNQQYLSIEEVLAQLQPLGEGSIRVWRRPLKKLKERIARVQYYAATVTLPATYKRKQLPQTLQLVWIREQPSQQQQQEVVVAEPIEWILLTDLAAETLQEAITIGNYYALRWVIERFHFILKSGLGIERLQIDLLLRLTNALQLYALVAWHVLWLQRLGKAHSEQAATDYIEQQAIEAVEAISGKQIITVKDFLVVTAALGGFIPTKKQPLPGEKTLWLGLQQLHAICKGFFAAKLKYGTS
jgi:hypothetical protein